MSEGLRWNRAFGMVGCAAACTLLGGCHSGNVTIDPVAMADLAGVTEVSPELSAMEFVSGSWRSLDKDGLSEEIWSLPHGKSMSGVFRIVKPDGALQMQETLLITAEPDGVYLRLRHFDAKLIAREDKEVPIVLKLEKAESNRALFRKVSGSVSLDTITYERTGQTLRGAVLFTPESKRETIKFEMRRPAVQSY